MTRLIENSGGKIISRIIKQRVKKPLEGFRFPQNHRFFDIFSTKINQMVTCGIVDHFSDQFNDLTYKKKFANLTIHLQAGFAVWLVSLIFPVTVFIVEWIITFKEFIVFNCVFNAYIEILRRNARNRNRKMRKALRKIKKRNEKKTQKACKASELPESKNDEIDSNQNKNETEVTIETIYDENDEFEELQNPVEVFYDEIMQI